MWLVFHEEEYSTYIGSHVSIQVYSNKPTRILKIITWRLALRESLEITDATIEVRQINPREAHREAKQEINLFSNTPPQLEHRKTRRSNWNEIQQTPKLEDLW